MTSAMMLSAPKASFVRTEINLGALGDDDVEIAVESCGICHSDLSMASNDWGITAYPLVPGHEVVGTIARVGRNVKARRVGDRVGLGWYSASCLHCQQCMRGDHNLCGGNQATMVNRPGGFATHVRCQWAWATPIPEGIELASAGPLFCGGITVFNPIVQFGVRPTDRVGVVGIGGLGHLAVQFLSKWGCEVFAFTSSDDKAREAKRFGAHHAVNSTRDSDLEKIKGRLDFLLVTVNVPLNWAAYVACLAPRGRMHFVGAVLEPVPAAVFPMIVSQLSLSASPLGSPATTSMMLDFCARHGIKPQSEYFAMSQADKAFAHVHAGKARYRVVVTNDLG
jgi:uncharacterized zinc-type alcohol dehydrogenase-like protein